ncbi:ankyrin repeat protein [Paraburkholderia fungorum]|jgi:ankyrin repeat protein|uniref:ankyrin repeat domain-containing protein n=1 Tax=Paraburkholderia fungorum TaxID=134537 RepID=UPI000D081A26|nr:ankyrin repeat domain-containing protein [Paraburkholderia fungorum]PRZ56464.1 ankyrin repeat protein [Paraburkholderia fungorum]
MLNLIARLAQTSVASARGIRSADRAARPPIPTPHPALLALRAQRWADVIKALDSEPRAIHDLTAWRGADRVNALMVAAAAGATECVARMAPSFDLWERDARQTSALMHAAASGDMGCFLAIRSLCLREDIVAVDAVGAPALFYAAQGGNPQILRALSAQTAMGWRDHHGRSVFHAAAGAGHTASLREAHGLIRPDLRLGLLTQGDEEGRTPLMHAAANGHLEAVKEIIALAGTATAAGVRAANKKGKTALAEAIGGSHYDCATLLASHMAQASPLLNAPAFEQAFAAAGRGITRASVAPDVVQAGARFIGDLARATGVDAREALAQLVTRGKLTGWRAAQAASEASRVARPVC